MRQSHKTILMLMMIALASTVAYELILGARGHDDTKPSFSGFMQEVEKNAAHIKSVKIDGQNYQVKFHRLTLPGMMVKLTLTHDEERQRLSFSYRRGDDVLTSGIIRLAAP